MKKVLVAVDDTKGSKSVLSVFGNLLRPPEEVILLHVIRLEGKSLITDVPGEAGSATLRESLDGSEYSEELNRKAKSVLNYYKKELENGGLIRIKTLIKEGIPADVILAVAEEEEVDLIITGSNEKNGLLKFITGYVSNQVEKKASLWQGREAYAI
ncbi:MAG TPA: universal stress protein [Dissulfurispiraceae bacterium]|nr:universal stress protein [Dissulfurispiraceae bacterium]